MTARLPPKTTPRKWRPTALPIDLVNAIHSNYFDAAVDGSGRGLVLGADPALGYPVP